MLYFGILGRLCGWNTCLYAMDDKRLKMSGEEMIMPVSYSLLIYFLGVSLIFVCVFLAVLIKEKTDNERLKSKIKNHDWICERVYANVRAAEMLITGERKGCERLSYVEGLLEHDEITIDAQVRAFIESAVYDMKKGK